VNVNGGIEGVGPSGCGAKRPAVGSYSAPQAGRPPRSGPDPYPAAVGWAFAAGLSASKAAKTSRTRPAHTYPKPQ